MTIRANEGIQNPSGHRHTESPSYLTLAPQPPGINKAPRWGYPISEAWPFNNTGQSRFHAWVRLPFLWIIVFFIFFFNVYLNWNLQTQRKWDSGWPEVSQNVLPVFCSTTDLFWMPIVSRLRDPGGRELGWKGPYPWALIQVSPGHRGHGRVFVLKPLGFSCARSQPTPNLSLNWASKCPCSLIWWSGVSIACRGKTSECLALYQWQLLSHLPGGPDVASDSPTKTKPRTARHLPETSQPSEERGPLPPIIAVSTKVTSLERPPLTAPSKIAPPMMLCPWGHMAFLLSIYPAIL